MKHWIYVIALLALVGTATACNTVGGMGRDLEKAGEALSGSAEDVKEKMQ